MTDLIDEMAKQAIEKAMESILFSFLFPVENIGLEQQIELKKIAKISNFYDQRVGLVIKASTNKEMFLSQNTINSLITTLAFTGLINSRNIDQVLFQRFHSDKEQIELYIVAITK